MDCQPFFFLVKKQRKTQLHTKRNNSNIITFSEKECNEKGEDLKAVKVEDEGEEDERRNRRNKIKRTVRRKIMGGKRSKYTKTCFKYKHSRQINWH